MNKAEILIVDDEPQIQKLLKITLENSDYNCRNSLSMICPLWSGNHPPELILLDIGLPDQSGHIILKELRQWFNKAIIMLSVQNSEDDIVQALDNGATDYLTKPFRTAELMARIRSAIRRNQTDDASSILEIGNLQIDLQARTVNKNGALLKLTATEFNLIAMFAKHEGSVLTHQYLLKEIWGVAYQTETQYLRVFVGTLRKKIEDNPNQPQHIITESGVGYRFQ
mgnify:CR=1 FL=1